MNSDTLLIGVDGGATEVKAHAVRCDDHDAPTAFELRPESAARVYPPAEGFNPVPVGEQFAQRDCGAIELSATEAEQGRLWVVAATEAIVDVARDCAATRVLVGMGMPGLKTVDGRGICVINNGPRNPRFLEMLEQGLREAGLGLAAPIATLGSDADYCGLGEEYAADGLFRDVESAYYVGCGTGIADAMKMRGRLVPFDAAKSWMQKAWQMAAAIGPTFEKLVSAKSLNRVYADLRTDAGVGARPERFPEADAAAGNPIAAACMECAALVLAELIFERLWTIKNGRGEAAHRGAAYLDLDREHTYRGLLLERVVIGQRVGLIYADSKYRAVFGNKLDACLASMIAEAGNTELAKACLSAAGGLKPGFLRASKLRAAPALGAAVAAAQAEGRRR